MLSADTHGRSLMSMFRSAARVVANSRLAVLITRWESRLHAILFDSHAAPWGLALFDQLIAGGANFVTILMLGRLAGAYDLGVFALVMTVYQLILAIQELLITVPYTIFGARLRGVRHLQYSGFALCQSTAWAVAVGTLLAIVAASLFLVRGDEMLTWVVAAFALVAPLWLLREFGRRYLFAHMQVGRVVAMSVAASTTQIIALGFFAYTGSLSAGTALCAIGFGSGLAAFGWLWLSRRAFHLNYVRSHYFLQKSWVLGRWVLASEATAVLASSVIPWFIVFLLGPAAAGIFAACDSILRFANPVIIAIRNVVTSKVSIDYSNGGRSAIRPTIWKAGAFLILFQSAFFILLAVAGEPILRRLFGEAYAAYWPVLVVLGLNQLVVRISLAPGRALLVVNRVSIFLWAEVTGFVISLVAATILTPRYGVLGGALALVAGNLLLVAWIVGAYFVVMRNDKGGEPLLLLRSSASATATGGVSK